MTLITGSRRPPRKLPPGALAQPGFRVRLRTVDPHDGRARAPFGSYNAGLYVAASVMVLGVALLLVLKVVERRDPQGGSGQP